MRFLLLLLIPISCFAERIGIVCAHPHELSTLVSNMTVESQDEVAGRTFYCGDLWGHESVIVTARVGKVAAAMTATHLIAAHKINKLLFIGVAGGVSPEVKQGDICVATSLIQHDMDARPFIPRYCLPLLSICLLKPDEYLFDLAKMSSEKVATTHTGLIGTGDQFISSEAQMSHLHNDWPQLLCVDMESAAIAQVCFEYDTPFAIVRIISDSCNSCSKEECFAFMEKRAPQMAEKILQNIYSRLN